jgi:hypothetical protein
MATGLAEIPRTQFAEWSVPDAVIENGSFLLTKSSVGLRNNLLDPHVPAHRRTCNGSD